MKEDQSLEQALCLAYCFYYKPGKNEELACRGRIVVERLLRNGRMIVFDKSDKRIDSATAEMLVQKMCMACDFHERDCDYMQDRAAPPCGGFILLAQLLSEGELSIEDIESYR
jgi:hypothetical protein